VLLAIWWDGLSNSINDISTPSTWLPGIFCLHGPPKEVPGNPETLKHWLSSFTGEESIAVDVLVCFHCGRHEGKEY
jgi:hypothetical protein